MTIVNGQVVPWQQKELLPDGRWQHYCVGCNQPHNIERMFRDSFDYRVRCDDCEFPDLGFQRLKTSLCE